MKILFSVFLCFLCVNLTLSVKDTYRAGVLLKPVNFDTYPSIIRDAAKSNVDILVLPSPKDESKNIDSESFDKILKSISTAVKQAGLYVVAHLYEKTRCPNNYEVVRSNLVFDREGSVIAVYRKPVNTIANCTTSQDVSFTTDFGTFGVFMEEDLVLHDDDKVKGLKNFVVAGSVTSSIPFLRASQFAVSWAYSKHSNVISSAGIYSGRAGKVGAGADVLIADISKDNFGNHQPPITLPTSYPQEDLSHYIIRPLNLQASSLQGVKETVCHGKFCCEFEIKGGLDGSVENEVSYGLAVFNGVRHYNGGHRVGLQVCAVSACAGVYKRSCGFGSNNNTTNTVFEKIIIRSNATNSNSEYPLILSTDVPSKFKFDVSRRQNLKIVTAEVSGTKNLFNFGIVNRVYDRDSEIHIKNEMRQGLTDDIYDYFFNQDTQEFFDYMWIRIRILAVVVSIYVLEML